MQHLLRRSPQIEPMVFSSTAFLFAFLPLALLSFYVTPPRWRAVPLVVSSAIFYAWGEPVLVALIMASAVVNYGIGKVLARGIAQRWVLAGGIIINLLPLVVLKYSVFLLQAVGLDELADRVHLPLPIGVSFYTFMAIGYLVEIYRDARQEAGSLTRFGAFLMMFPHLVAGPIVRWEAIGWQLQRPTFHPGLFGYGAMRVVGGLAKKCLIADQLAVQVDALYALESMPSAGAAWAAAVMYSLQIYFDFSAYSDIAIGLAAMLGIRFEENFRYPYQATSAREFWQRWHISLGSWFRDYVYVPMGGSRVGRAKLWRNLLVVWALTGIWHGAAWTFVVWGLYFGCLIGFERGALGRGVQRMPWAARHAYGLLVALIGWVIFRSTSMGQAGDVLSSLFGLSGVPLWDGWASLVWGQSMGPLVIGTLLAAGVLRSAVARLEAALDAEPTHAADRQPREATLSPLGGILLATAVCVGLLLAASFIVSVSYSPFIYFRF